MKKLVAVLAMSLAIVFAIAGCASPSGTAKTPSAESSQTSPGSEYSTSEQRAAAQQPETADGAQDSGGGDKAAELRLSISGTDVSVEWEDNQAVADLRALAADGPVTVDLSMYGGFEQVGPLGASLTASDVQMMTEPGDIVLYAGNQISIFYGPNSWAYTKLGRVTDRTAVEMADLLGNGDVSITIAIR